MYEEIHFLPLFKSAYLCVVSQGRWSRELHVSITVTLVGVVVAAAAEWWGGRGGGRRGRGCGWRGKWRDGLGRAAEELIVVAAAAAPAAAAQHRRTTTIADDPPTEEDRISGCHDD